MVRLLFFLILFSCAYRPSINNGRSVDIPDNATESERSYATSVYPLLKANCQVCHGADKAGPPFAVDDPIESHKNLINLGMVSYIDLENSAIFRQVEDLHNQPSWAWQDGEVAKSELLDALKQWKPSMDKDLLLPNGIISQDVNLSDGITEYTVDVNPTELPGVSISFNLEVDEQDNNFYKVENLRLQTGNAPIALREISFHVNDVLDNQHTEFKFISDVVSANSEKIISRRVQNTNSPDAESNQVRAYLLIRDGINSDVVTISFKDITVYN